MTRNLTSGILPSIYLCPDSNNLPSNPIVQVLGIKKVGNNSERYRAILSDGSFFSGSVLFTSKTCDLISSEVLSVNAVIKLLKYTFHVLQDKKFIVVLDAEVIASGDEISMTIGEPKPFTEGTKVNNENHTQDSSIINKEIVADSRKRPMAVTQPKNSNMSKGVSASTHSIIPIKAITVYQNKWTIRAKVSNKSPIKTWQNSKGEGKLFSFELIDEEQGEMRVTAFNEQVDRFFDLIQVGKVYYFSKASVRIANKAFTSIKSEYEIVLNSDSVIELCDGCDLEIPSILYSFTKLVNIETLAPNSIIDILAIIKSYGELKTITTKQTNKEVKKRELVIVDSSEKSIVFTLWGDNAENEAYCQEEIVFACKRVKVGDYNGKQLSTIMGSKIDINPNIQEATQLQKWYENYGKITEFVSIGPGANSTGNVSFEKNVKLLSSIVDEKLGSDSKPDYLNVTAMVLNFKSENALYKACPTDQCNKKLLEENDSYRCEKCNQEFPNFVYRLILNCQIADSSSSQWVTMFQENAEKILGKTAQEIGQVKDTLEHQEYEDIFYSKRFQYMNLKLRVKNEFFSDEVRLKVNCVNAVPIDFVNDGKLLIERIKSFTK